MTVEIDGANNIVKTNTISEVTSANGVTVDGLNIKDSKLVTANSVITANITDANVTTAKITDANVTQGKIADQAINEAKMQISNAPVNGYMLTAQSGNTGGMTWASAPSGGLTLLSMVDQDLGSAVKLQFQQVFNSAYDYYKVIGAFNLGSNSAHSVEFRFLNSSNSEMTTSQYYGVAQGWRYNSGANDRSDWGQWGSTGIDIGRDIEGGSAYKKVVLDMDIHPDAYASTTHNAFNWNIGYTKHQGGSESVSRIMGYGQYANSTDLSGGGIQLETQNSYDFVTMGIYGVKTTT